MEEGKYIVYDSGVGGLSVLREIIKQQINADFVYFADNKNVPYGNKDKNHIIDETLKNFKKLKKDYVIKGVIFASNTTSIMTKEIIQNELQVPVYSIADHTQRLIRNSGYRNIKLLATQNTVDSDFFSPDKDCRYEAFPCPSFVPLVEGEMYQKKLKRLNTVLDQLKEMSLKKSSEVYLGCTHYSFLLKEISVFTGVGSKVIDPTITFGEELKEALDRKQSDKISIIFEASAQTGKIENFFKENVFEELSSADKLKIINMYEEQEFEKK